MAVGNDSKGYFIAPTVILVKDPKSVTMVEEIFGPVLTVSVSSTILFRVLEINMVGRLFTGLCV